MGEGSLCVLVCFCSAEGARAPCCPCGALGAAGFVALVEQCARALWGHLQQQGAGQGGWSPEIKLSPPVGSRSARLGVLGLALGHYSTLFFTEKDWDRLHREVVESSLEVFKGV